jgi:hypothetical protein
MGWMAKALWLDYLLEQEIFLILKLSRDLWGPLSHLFTEFWGLFLRAETARVWSSPLTVSSGKFKNAWRNTSSQLYAFVACMGTASLFSLYSVMLVCHLAFNFVMEATGVGME